MSIWISLGYYLIIMTSINAQNAGMCPAVTSVNAEFSCKYYGTDVSCDSPMRDGTVLSTRCKERHFSNSDTSKKVTCRNGEWNDLIPHCIPDCGIEKGEATVFSIGGTDVRRGEVPWQVAIFSYAGDDESMEQICGGTLITVNIVVSAAHCIWNERLGIPNHPILYEVAVGKIYREYDNEEDSSYHYVQKSYVKEIIVPKKYSGNERHYQADIALLILDKPFTFSHSVHSACLDLTNATFDEQQIAKGKIGKVAGWGITEDNKPSKVLKTVDLPIVEITSCQRAMPQTFQQYLTLDKLCVGYMNGTAICRGDSGGGLVFSSTHGNTIRWYLRGIASVSVPSKNPDLCLNDTYSGFTHVFKHAEWIKKVLVEYQQFTTNDGCMLPLHPDNGIYTIKEYPNMRPGQIVPPSTYVEYNCNQGYSLHGKKIVHCNSDGSWDSKNRCVRMCSPIPSKEYRWLRCSKNGVDVSCKNMIESGIVVDLRCKQDPIRDLINGYPEPFVCTEGSWNREFPSCDIYKTSGTMTADAIRSIIPKDNSLYKNYLA